MKKIALFFLITFCFSCASIKRDEAAYDYYYYSYTAYKHKDNMIHAGVKPSPNHSTIDGLEYTIWCTPKDFKDYKKRFPDAVLVKRLKKNTRQHHIHF